MTDVPESHRDLLDAQFATLATVGDDGLPQLTEVWFLYEDGEVKTSLNTARVKTRNLTHRASWRRSSPRACTRSTCRAST